MVNVWFGPRHFNDNLGIEDDPQWHPKGGPI
jgi:hypothetical protein